MTYKLQQYGYAPYAAVAAGTLATLQIGILISTPKDELLSALGHFRKYFTDALILDPNIQPETVRTTLERTKLEEDNRWQYISQFPQRGYLGGAIWDLPEDQTGFYAYYLTLKGALPARDKSVGFRFDADGPEQVDNVHVNGDERNWPYYPHLIPDMSDVIEHYDGAMDGRATVLRWINGKLTDHDDSWTRLSGLETVLENINEFIPKLNSIEKYIRTHYLPGRGIANNRK